MSSLELQIFESGLTQEHLAKLSRSQVEYLTFSQYLFQKGILRDKSKIRGIGLGHRAEMSAFSHYKEACRVFDLAYCMNFQQMFGISYSSSKAPGTNRKNAENQMCNLITQDLPFTFFVPPYMSGQNHNDTLTSQEMWWIVRNAESVPKIEFVCDGRGRLSRRIHGTPKCDEYLNP